MEKKRLVKILHGLPKELCREFLEYLNSPFADSPKWEAHLLAGLLRFVIFPSSPKSKVNDEDEFWQKVFPDKNYSPYYRANRMSKVRKSLDLFLALNRVKKSEQWTTFFMLKEYRERDLVPQSQLETMGKKAMKGFSSGDLPNDSFFKYHTQLTLALLSCLDRNRNCLNNIEMAGKDLERYYHTQNIRLIFSQLNHHRIFRSQGEISTMIPTLDYITAHYSQVNLASKIYFHATLAIKNNSKVDIYTVMRFLQEIAPSDANISMVDELISCCTNLLISMYREKEDFTLIVKLAQNYELYLRLVVDVKQSISVADFKNIVTIYARIGSFSKATEVLQQYIQFVEESKRSDALLFGKATVAFYKKDFKAVLRFLFLMGKSPKDIFFEYDRRTLQSRALYELRDDKDYHDSLPDLLESFRRFSGVHKQKIAKSQQLQYKNFFEAIRGLKKLYDSKHKNKLVPEDLDRLEKEFVEQTHLPHRNWFLEKIAEFRVD